MSSSAPRTTALSPQAFATLLLLACMMAGNHVAARIAMDHGLDVITAVATRRPSDCTACGDTTTADPVSPAASSA